MNMTTNKILDKEAGWNYLLLALVAFGGLGIEMLYAFLLEPLIWGNPLQEFTAIQNIIHWIVTCITWGLIAFLLIRFARNKMNFDLFAKNEKLKAWQWVISIALVIISLIISYIDWNGFKIIKEFQYNGTAKFIFQYVYYMFETVLFTLIIVFGQKAFEQWTHKRKIPWGGILCALTWGLVHVLSQGSISAGLLSALYGLMFGLIYLLVNKDIKKAYVLLLIMFVF